MKTALPLIPIARPDIGPLEISNVSACVQSGWVTQGKFVQRCEGMLRDITGRRYAVCSSSGTMSLLATLLAAGLKNDCIVAAPSLTFAAVHNAIKIAGGSVHYQGADLDSWQVPASDWDNNFDCAVIAPCYGKLEGTDSQHARKSVKFLIEDAAESFGGLLNGKSAGSFGDASCLSFFGNKICTSSEGGAILTDDAILERRVRTVINHGINNKSYVPSMIGLNGRLTDLHASLLVAQLERLPQMLERRREIMQEYRKASSAGWGMMSAAPGEVMAPWLFAGIPSSTAEVWQRAKDANVEIRSFFPIPADAPRSPSLDVARRLSQRGVCLPLSSAMTDEEVERVCQIIKS